MGTPLPKIFFDRPVLEVAEDLLGKVLVRGDVEGGIQGIITDIEAYDGPDDLACHGRFGCTPRTIPMFGPAGHWYVYLVYGMHWMLNIVTGPVGYPAAVLMRGVGEWVGPGKLTKELHIDKRFNALPATKETGLWIEDRGIAIPQKQIQRTPRIGVDYAGVWTKKPYRFVLALPITLLFLAACAAPVPSSMTMKLSSPAFTHNGSIPALYTCDGEDRSPPLHISGVPSEAKSLVLINDDPDAPMGTWVHWLLWNIEPKTMQIREGSIPPRVIEGTTSFRQTGYGGPCPPSGTHRYFFKLYALDTTLDLPRSADKAKLEKAFEGHILAKAELMGLYQRSR